MIRLYFLRNMTICECLEKKEIDSYAWFLVDIIFYNSCEIEDETEFSVQDLSTKEGKEELSELFEVFCKENGYDANSVIDVKIVKVSPKYEWLELRWHSMGKKRLDILMNECQERYPVLYKEVKALIQKDDDFWAPQARNGYVHLSDDANRQYAAMCREYGLKMR